MDAPDGTRDPIVLHSDDGARAVLIVLQAGQSLGDHQVKENAWVVIVEGTVQVSANGDTVELGPGGLLRFEPGERHSLASTVPRRGSSSAGRRSPAGWRSPTPSAS